MQGKRKQLQCGDIAIPSVRITAVYDEELTEQLHESLNAAGQIVPIIVVETDSGLVLVDGKHRLEEAIARGDNTIDSIVIPGDSITTLTYNLLTNNLRGKVKASEMVNVIDELTKTHGLDSDEIARRTGLTRNYIERLWKIAEAAPSVRDALDKGLVGVGVAFEVARLPHVEQQDDVMSTVYMYHMTTTQAHDFVEDILRRMQAPQAEPVKKEPQPQAPPACEVCGAMPPANLLVQVQLGPECFGELTRLSRERTANSNSAETPLVKGETP